MIEDIAFGLFIASWLVACSCVDMMFDDWRAGVAAVASVIFAVVCAAVMCEKGELKNDKSRN